MYGEIKWVNVWKMVHKIKEPRIETESLVYKILHKVYPTRLHLFKWKISKIDDNLCTFCKEIDTYEHFFYNCKKINCIWKEVLSHIKVKFGFSGNFEVKDVLIMYVNNNRNIENYVNIIINIAKLCISKFKYGHYPNILSLFEFELRLRELQL